VKFLTQRGARLNAEYARSEPPLRPQTYEFADLLKAYVSVRKPGEGQGGGVVTRPSNIAGAKYDEVSEAYARAVHAVLTGKAESAASGGGIGEGAGEQSQALRRAGSIRSGIF